MDNATYDEVGLTPIGNDETYSRLRVTETKSKPRYELQKMDHHALKEVQQTNVIKSANTTKFNTVMIIMMVLFLLITLVSIALSVTTLNRLASEQSKVLSQLENTNNDIVSQLDTIKMNLSQKVLELVIFQSTISQDLNQIDTKHESSFLLLAHYLNFSVQIHCGPGLWHRLAYLNMSDPSQQCPSVWREYNESGVRACGRPTTRRGSCASIPYISYQQYSQVCGRIIGYQYASPDAFERHPPHNNHINLDGINITRGANRNHIWSYVAGFNQNSSSQSQSKCPCSTENGQGHSHASSVGDNYYCESGNPNVQHTSKLYSDDPLWDGQQCEGTCCTGTNSPPWFSVQLPAPTTEGIEVSICCDQGTDDEDVPVKLIEIFVQ
jgi:hypothetical protein